MANPTAAQRRVYSKMGLSMPDGSYYIRKGTVGAADLQNAIMAVGRGVAAGDDGNAIRCHIMKRAAALGLSDKIPDTWAADGSLKHSADQIAEVIEHFGVRGMKWGQRKDRGPASEDHTAVAGIKAKVRSAGGIHTLSNAELRTLTDRLNLEANYHRLTEVDGAHVKRGEDFVKTNTGRLKTAVDAYNTGKQVYNIVNEVKKAGKK